MAADKINKAFGGYLSEKRKGRAPDQLPEIVVTKSRADLEREDVERDERGVRSDKNKHEPENSNLEGNDSDENDK